MPRMVLAGTEADCTLHTITHEVQGLFGGAGRAPRATSDGDEDIKEALATAGLL